jgi:putative transposase
VEGPQQPRSSTPQSPKGTEFISPARKCGAGSKERNRVPSGTAPLMSHTHAANFVHCVFSTKERHNLIPTDSQEQLYAYLIGIADNLGFKILAAGGTSNHVHLLVALPPALTLAEAMQKLKANSSRWLRNNGAAFEWQKGYGAFSVSPSLLPTVQAYIRNQPEHHKKRSFEEEFRALLDKSGVAYDADRLFAA